MSIVRTKHYQECDICHKTIELVVEGSDVTRLSEVALPIKAIYQDGSRKTVIRKLSVCSDCIEELRKVIQTGYDIEELEYQGVVARRKENDTEHPAAE